jgi:hypothetical protein
MIIISHNQHRQLWRRMSVQDCLLPGIGTGSERKNNIDLGLSCLAGLI